MRKKKGGGNSVANAVKREQKQRVGNESYYRPEYCKVVLRMGSEGSSEAEMAVLGCGVTRKTMRFWAKNNPDFADALAMANEASLMWWEHTGRRRLRDKQFNVGLYNKIVSCRFRKEYGEHLKLTGDENEPLTITTIRRVIVDPKDA